MVLKDKKEKINQSPQPLLRKTLLEELSRARKIQLLQKDKKPQKSKDSSLILELEERELVKMIKLEDGKNQLKQELLTTK